MQALIEQFKAVSDTTRLKILWLLCRSRQALCVCEIVDAVGARHCNISRHLKILRLANLVQESRQGKWNYYALAPSQDPSQERLLQSITVLPDDQFRTEWDKLRLRMSLRQDGKCIEGLESPRWTAEVCALKLVPRKSGASCQNSGA